MTPVRRSYLICTNPRSGSWLLAEGLRSCGLAGRPEEYANPALQRLYARDFGLPADVPAAARWERILAAGTSANGIFGAKVHRLHYEALLELLRCATGDRDADEVSLLTSALPGLTFVHHDRNDRAGQALSWYRALATDNWWHVRDVRDVRGEEALDLDVRHVAALERRLDADDAAWQDLFARSALPTVRSSYEELVSDHAATIRRIVRAVGGPASVSVSPPALERQADRVTDRWRAQYVRARRRPGNAGASVVVVSHNEGENLVRTVDALRSTTPESTEFVVVDDCSTDGSVAALRSAFPEVRIVPAATRLGVAGSRNLGAAASTGDVLVFSDAHVTAEDGWLPALLDVLHDPGVGEVAPTVCDMHNPATRGYGFTWPDLGMGVSWLRDVPADVTDIPFVCGCFLAIRRDTFDDVGGFDDGLVRWGSEDAELSLRIWRRGLRCVVAPDSVIAHLFRPRFSYAVEWEHTLHNMVRVAAVHFPPDLLGAVLQQHRAHPAFAGAVARLDIVDIHERRRDAERRGFRDAREILDHFGIPLAASLAEAADDGTGVEGEVA